MIEVVPHDHENYSKKLHLHAIKTQDHFTNEVIVQPYHLIPDLSSLNLIFRVKLRFKRA